MTRLESSAWTLAGGSLSAFAVAVPLSDAPWRYALVALAAVAAAWSWRAPLVVSLVIGCIAWSFLTGFDVNEYGHLAITGLGDAVHVVLLVAAAGGVAVVGRLRAGRTERYPMEVTPLAPEQVVLIGVHESSGVSDSRYGRSFKVPM